MLLEEVFLDRGSLQKYEMFVALKALDSENFTINTLSEQMEISYQQAYNIFQSLLDDFVKMSESVTKSDENTLKVIANNDFPISQDDYRLFLLKDSYIFNCVNAIVQGNNVKLADFCNEYFISKSTLIRKINPLRKMLKQYGIKISLTQFQFVGDEMNIREFLFQFYWISYHGVEWPFKMVNLSEVKQLYRKLRPELRENPIQRIQDFYMLGVCRARMGKKFFVQSTERFDQVFKDYDYPLTSTGDFYTHAENSTLSKEELHNENNFVSLMFLKEVRFSQTPDPLSDEIYDFFKSKRSPAWEFVQAFLNYFDRVKINGDVEPWSDNHALVANLLRVTFTTYIIGINYPKLFDFYRPDQTDFEVQMMEEKMRGFFDQSERLRQFDFFIGFKDSLVEVFKHMFLPYMTLMKSVNRVKVKLVVEHTGLLNRELIDFLSDAHMVDLLPDNADNDDVDVFVTSIATHSEAFKNAMPELKENQITINWSNETHDHDFYTLYTRLKHVYLQKIGAEQIIDVAEVEEA